MARVCVSEFQDLRGCQFDKKFALTWMWRKYSMKLLQNHFFWDKNYLKEQRALSTYFLLLLLSFVKMISYLHPIINTNIFTGISNQKLTINNNLFQCSFKSEFHYFLFSSNSNSISSQNLFIFCQYKMFSLQPNSLASDGTICISPKQWYIRSLCNWVQIFWGKC